jgi:hypothetical protein
MPEVRRAAFYCVTGRDFYPGAVALLNSLRLLGHREPMFVLDCGMDERQRRLLAPHATVVPAPSDAPPSLQKLVAPLTRPAEVMVLIDADVVVTRSLSELIESAAEGRVVAFRNDIQRFFPDWEELLEVGVVKPRPYLSSSTLLVQGELARSFMPLVAERQMQVNPDRTWLGDGTEADPFFYLDQDVLNAVLHARVPRDRVFALDHRLSPIPPFSGLRLVDETALRCAYSDGIEPYALHHASRKPWLVPMRSNIYSRLLTRLLLGSDVTLRLDPDSLPLRLRTGLGPQAQRLGIDLLLGVPGAYRRLTRRRPRIAAWPNLLAL